MNTRIVLTMIAPDQPGLVEKVSQVIVDHGGSWLASRMSHLDGMFAGILSVSVDEAQKSSLVEALYQLEASGIKLIVEQSNNDETDGETYVFTVTGSDRPGIVNEISTVLARESINVEELVSDCVSAAMSGETAGTCRRHTRSHRRRTAQ